MPAEGRENPLLKKGNSDAFFREKYLTKNTYGYLWWVNEDGYAAMGDGGNIIYVNTKDKIVVSSSALFVPKIRDRIDLIKTYIEPIFR